MLENLDRDQVSALRSSQLCISWCCCFHNTVQNVSKNIYIHVNIRKVSTIKLISTTSSLSNKSRLMLSAINKGTTLGVPHYIPESLNINQPYDPHTRV